MFLLAALSASAEPTASDPLYDLEVLYRQRAWAEGVRQTDLRIGAEPANTDLYWTKARFLFEIGEVQPRDGAVLDKEALYSEMLEVVQTGLALAPNDPGLRFARAAAKARLGTTRGVLASLFMAREIEADWLFVADHPTYRYESLGRVQMLPCDAFHALGIFYRLVPDRWIVSVLAGTSGDLDRSLAFHERAVACKGNEIKNWKELGATQLCLGYRRQDDPLIAAGRSSLERGMALPRSSEKDRIDHHHSGALLADPSLACGYSRDGQQDLGPPPDP